jgi:hypothetical protein
MFNQRYTWSHQVEIGDGEMYVCRRIFFGLESDGRYTGLMYREWRRGSRLETEKSEIGS